MTTRKIVIRAALVLIALPIVLVLLAFGFFYSVFYFPNRTSATAGTIVSSGQKRHYLLYIPKSYNRAKPTPLVITLHTSMSWDSAAMAISRWNSVADENGFLVVYPEGTGLGPKPWEMAGSETPSRMPDVLFVAELIDSLGASYSIDKTRIYANGMSNGGGMAFVLSCTLPDRIAAVGMVSAGLDPGWDWCTDHTPVPVIAFHGTADPVVPYNGGPSKLGGGTFPNVPEFFAKWSRRNQCGPNPIESVVATDVMRLQYAGCANDGEVVLYTIKGEGHQWPGGGRIAAERMVGPYSHSIDATRQMWAFFHEHRLTRKGGAQSFPSLETLRRFEGENRRVREAEARTVW
jgi:polyhydroxybutyrate depolymerase